MLIMHSHVRISRNITESIATTLSKTRYCSGAAAAPQATPDAVVVGAVGVAQSFHSSSRARNSNSTRPLLLIVRMLRAMAL